MGGQLIVFRWACCVSLLLCAVPLTWHWRNKNIPACFLIIWLSIFNLCSFVNSFLWPTDFDLFTGWEGGIYCDIQVKVLVAGFTGHLGAMAAIARNLAVILSDDAPVIRTKSIRRKELYKDLGLCLAIPIFMMAVHYIVQPRRYILYTITGCTAVVDRSWPSIALIFIWPPITAIMAGYYAVLVIYRLHKHRRRFSALLSNNSSLTRSRFLRLFILSILLLLLFLPITFYVFARNLDFEWLPYSWEEVHYGDNWLWIRKIPTNGNINFDRWVPIATGVLVFLIFGLGKDAMVLYRAWLNTIGVGRFLPKWIMEPKTPQSSLGPYSGGTTETTTTTTTTNAAATASTWLRRQRNPFRGKEDVEHSAVETDVASNSTTVTKDFDVDDGEDMEWPPRPERARHQHRSPVSDPHDRLGSLGSLEPLRVDLEPADFMAEIGTSPVGLPELQVHGKGKSVE